MPEETITPILNQMTQEECETRKKRNRKIGFLWLVGPIITLVIILAINAIASFVVLQSYTPALDGGIGLAQSNGLITIARIIKVIAGLVGILATLCIFIGIPVGIIYLSKREELPNMKFDPRSGKGNASEVPAEINHWSWGAFGMNWIWGIVHHVWISLLVFIPFVNFFVVIYLGFAGNKLAWQADKWESVEKFLESERKWKPWGIFFFIFGVLMFLFRTMFSLLTLFN